MAKRISERQREEIVELFFNGKTINELSDQFECTKLTIIRNLKKNLGELKYKEIAIKNSSDQEIEKSSLGNENLIQSEDQKLDFSKNEILEEDFLPITPFLELTPINFDIENAPQKDLSSIHISEINFPNVLYMVVDKKIELVIKLLKDFPEWQFLSKDELSRKTIEIFDDLRVAKRACNKEQKVIKVPNTEVFKIVAPLLISKGITRIISSDKLIAL